jgi:superfamily II DNA helicase RecQ
LFPYKGHIPRFATFLHEPKLVKKISYIFIDEAHFIKTSGTAIDGEPPHRPSYARLGEIRARLPAGIPVALLSATLPPDVMEICTKSLHMKPSNTTYIKLSTNHPNLMHAMIPMLGDISNFANLDFLVPLLYHPLMAPIKKTLLFIESKLKTGHLTRYLLR